jgi:hypothetical protein
MNDLDLKGIEGRIANSAIFRAELQIPLSWGLFFA